MVTRSSKRGALELLPGTLVPGVASVAGLVLVGHYAGARTLGLVSLAWVTSNAGSSLLAEGPGNAALRAVATGRTSEIEGFRRAVWRRVAVWCPTVAAVGVVFAVAGSAVGAPLAFGALWMGTQTLVQFETQALKAEQRFMRASTLAAIRGALGWAASVAGAAVVGGVAGTVLPNVVVSLVVVALIGSRTTAPVSSRVAADIRAIGRPVTVLLLAGYLLGYGDRFIIEAILGPVAVGVYTLGYQIGDGAIELVSGPVTNALLPRVVAEWNDPAAGRQVALGTAKRGAVVHVVAGALAVPLVFVASRVGLFDLVSHDEHIAFITAIVAVAVAVNGIARLAFGLLLAQGRPQRTLPWAWATVAISAVTVPVLTATEGIAGAAVATLIGYFVLAVLYTREALTQPERR